MKSSPSEMTLGILASILAALLFTVMDVSAKAIGHLGTGELTFARGLMGLLFLPLIARKEGLPLFSGCAGHDGRSWYFTLLFLPQRIDFGRCRDSCPTGSIFYVYFITPFLKKYTIRADLALVVCDCHRGGYGASSMEFFFF